MGTVTDYFGSLVFDDRVMKATLSAKVYASLKKTIDEGTGSSLRKGFPFQRGQEQNGICSKYDNLGLRLKLNISKALEKREVMQITRP